MPILHRLTASLIVFSGLTLSFSAFSAEKPCAASDPSLRFLVKRAKFCRYSGELTAEDPLAPGTERSVPFTYYRVRKNRAPFIMLYRSLAPKPPAAEEVLAKRLAKNGFHVMLVEHPESLADINRPPEEIDHFFIRSTWSSRKLLDRVENWSEVRPEYYALGISLGGMRATLAFGDDFRFRKLITYVAGGNLPEVLALSTHSLLTRYRKVWMPKLGLKTREEYIDFLKHTLRQDPLHAGGKRPPSQVYTVIGTADKIVPTVNQFDLWNALGRPRYRLAPGSHEFAGGSFWPYFKEITSFFRDSPRPFAAKAPRAGASRTSSIFGIRTNASADPERAPYDVHPALP